MDWEVQSLTSRGALLLRDLGQECGLALEEAQQEWHGSCSLE